MGDGAAPRPATRSSRGLGWLGSGITLGGLIAVLAVLIALASYQAMRATWDRAPAETEAHRLLGQADAAHRAANQAVITDYTSYDSWYLHRDQPNAAGAYPASFSPALRAAVERNVDDPFDDAYYEQMYQSARALYAQAESAFAVVETHDARNARLQLVVTVSAVGLALAAGAALLGSRRRLRLLLAALAILALVGGAAAYFTAPPL